MKEPFFNLWFRTNVEFKAGRLPWLRHPGGVLQARRNPLHDRECACRSCAFGRAEAGLAVRDWLEGTRRQARGRIFEERATWVRPILTGFQGESVLDDEE